MSYKRDLIAHIKFNGDQINLQNLMYMRFLFRSKILHMSLGMQKKLKRKFVDEVGRPSKKTLNAHSKAWKRSAINFVTALIVA